MTDTIGIGRALTTLAPTAILAALVSAGLIAALLPWLRTHVVAHPNARSSHRTPTPQGGGGAVVIATFAAAWAGVAIHGAIAGGTGQFAALTAAAALLAVVGGIDDLRALTPFPRLLLQIAAVAIVIAALPADARLVPALPTWLERTVLVIGFVWIVNLTNFMDGIDWMTVAELVPVTGAIVVLGLMGAVATLPMLVAAALLGAMLGFAPFNKPVARLFLGDVGSLPLGILLAWLIFELALQGHRAAAVLLPLYYLADATLTLVRRVVAGEPFWQAHRRHFYQRALGGGYTVPAVVARVFAINLGLAALAIVTVAVPEPVAAFAALAAGAILVGGLLVRFERGNA